MGGSADPALREVLRGDLEKVLERGLARERGREPGGPRRRSGRTADRAILEPRRPRHRLARLRTAARRAGGRRQRARGARRAVPGHRDATRRRGPAARAVRRDRGIRSPPRTVDGSIRMSRASAGGTLAGMLEVLLSDSTLRSDPASLARHRRVRRRRLPGGVRGRAAGRRAGRCARPPRARGGDAVPRAPALPAAPGRRQRGARRGRADRRLARRAADDTCRERDLSRRRAGAGGGGRGRRRRRQPRHRDDPRHLTGPGGEAAAHDGPLLDTDRAAAARPPPLRGDRPRRGRVAARHDDRGPPRGRARIGAPDHRAGRRRHRAPPRSAAGWS